MKKRLLSALLALVMVLTMLPATVFADDPTSPESGKSKIKYYAGMDIDKELDNGTDHIPAGTWVYEYSVKEGTTTVKKYQAVTSGVAAGSTSSATWYSNINDAYEKSTSFVLIDDSQTLSTEVSKNITVDVQGHALSISNGINCAKTSTITVTDSLYKKGVIASQGGVTFTGGVSNSGELTKSVNVTVRDAALSGGIDLVGNVSRTITLENATVSGGITLNGYESGTNNAKQAAQRLTATLGTVIYGDIIVQGTGSQVSLTDTSAGNVKVHGAGTTVTIDGVSNVDMLGVSGSEKINSKASSGNAPTVNLKGGTVSALYQDTSWEESITKPYKVTIEGKAAISRKINLVNADITIKQGEVQDEGIELGKGTLNIQGPNAVVGPVNLGKSDAANSVKMSVSGNNNTVGIITATGTTKHTLDIVNDRTNYIEDVTPFTGFNKGGIKGGTFGKEINADLLNRTGTDALQYRLCYQPTGGTQKFAYYTRLELAALISDYVRSGQTQDAVLIGHGDANPNDDDILVIYNGSNNALISIRYNHTLASKIVLPAEVNGIKVNSWTDGAKNTWRGEYPLPVVATPNPTPATLNMQSTGTDISKLTNATVKAAADPLGVSHTHENNVRASLNGNVISLSGAVNPNNGGTQIFYLYLTTDMVKEDGTYVEVVIPVVYDSANKSQSLTIGNMNNAATALTGGMTAQEGQTILKLSNGTTYTLNGSGLKVPTGDYTVDLTLKEIVATDKVSGHTAGEKAQLESYLSSVLNDTNTNDSGTNDGTVTADFTNSPAILQAINAVEANITESQVNGWINKAQTTYWRNNYVGSSDKDKLKLDGYNKVYIVPYLNVTATAFNPNQTITLTMEPCYRVEVRSGKFGQDDPVGLGKHAPVVVEYGKSLGKLEDGNDVMGTVTVKLNFPTSGTAANSKIPTGWMHQDATYAYQGATANTFAIKHAGANNGLGTMIINSDAPLVTMTDGTNDVGFGYNTLQAAVDDAKNNYVINVDANYKGSMAINVTGEARKFKIVANGNTGVTTNTSNGLVDVTRSGHEYTVQLTRDVAATVDGTTASIAVATVNNGSARVSATSAKSGSTVTVTTTPAAGYRTSGVSVTAHMTKTNTNAAVSVTRSSDNVYTFKVPEGASSITVTPAFVVGTTSTGLPFYDVAANDYYYEAVKYVYDNGLMNGVNTTGTQFGGSQTLNRAMVVTILYRAAGSPNVSSVSGFNDVANNTWYSQAVTWGNQNGIVQGDADATGKLTGTFRPADPISRQELATILYRYNTNYRGRATTGSTTLTNYVDQGSVSSWATAGMQWAVGNGIVNGTTNTTLTPGGNATRYQAATMLMRYGKGFGL